MYFHGSEIIGYNFYNIFITFCYIISLKNLDPEITHLFNIFPNFIKYNLTFCYIISVKNLDLEKLY